MKFDEIKELIELINVSDLAYFEVKTENDYIKMDKSLSRNIENTSSRNYESEVSISKEEKINLSTEETKVSLENNVNDDITINNNEEFEYIKCPMVGTFYSAISPDADPFVTEGQKVSKGKVLCIVEAMKLMNEIVADFDFELVSILVENSAMVEYGQPLFKIRRK